MKLDTKVLLLFGALTLPGCASVSVEKAKFVPSRIDVAGHVESVEYTDKGMGMERPWKATLNGGDYGDFTANLVGYGKNGYQTLERAKRENALVGVQCSEPKVDPCKVVAVEGFYEPRQIPPGATSRFPDSSNPYHPEMSFSSNLYNDEQINIVQRTDQQNASQCSKRQVKQWKKDLESLTKEELGWMSLWSRSQKVYDFTGDGVDDTLEVIGTQSLRNCNLRDNIPNKDILVTLVNGATGKKRLWNWLGGIPTAYKGIPSKRELTITGKLYSGEPFSKVLTY